MRRSSLFFRAYLTPSLGACLMYSRTLQELLDALTITTAKAQKERAARLIFLHYEALYGRTDTVHRLSPESFRRCVAVLHH